MAEKLREQQVADAKKQAEESMYGVSAREARAYMGLGGQAGRVRLCAELWHVCSLEGLPPCVWPTRSSRLTVEGGEEATEPGREEERAGREAGHGTGVPKVRPRLGVQKGNAIVLLGTPGGSC